MQYFCKILDDKAVQLTLTTTEENQRLNVSKECLSNQSSGLSESGKNSSESVEVLSGGTECTTSPDSDAFSISSPSSNHGNKHRIIFLFYFYYLRDFRNETNFRVSRDSAG